ncbi:hypothetical protein NQZ68_000152, partial [Dissostichus eleginoides]
MKSNILCLVYQLPDKRLSDLNRIVVRAPGAEQTDIPPLCSNRQRGEREKREKLEKGRI